MATFTVHAGWDFDRIGALSFSLTESVGGGAAPVNISTGTACHVDLSSAMGSGEYVDFATTLKAALEAASVNALTYTVTFSETALTYSISASSGNITLSSMNGNALAILGFTASSRGPSATLTSDRGVRYSVIASPSGLTRSWDEEDEPDDIADDAEAGSSTFYGLADASVPSYRNWRLQYINAARVRAVDAATGTFPYTFEDFWKHVRNVEPFAAKDDLVDQVYAMRAEAAKWNPQEWIDNHKDRFNLRFRTRVLGDL